ncbi:MAG: hydrogenase iron-sulfur subunit, partial [Rhodospirillales bacterium]|nr:hydrogenase iron-sulfur subunit [Rhodospirillales bacterium]
MSVERKIGVYLCSGCGIGDAVNVDEMETAANALKVPLCKKHEYLCGDEGCKTIADDIKAEGLTHVTIAACSPRVMTDRFDFPGTLVTRANIREQVAWSHAAGDEDTQALANDNLRMAIVEAQKTSLPEAWTEGDFTKTVMVVGGGWSGMNAARAASKAGHEVILVERSDALGGQAAKASKVAPAHPPYREPADNPAPAMVGEVEGDGRIKVMLNTLVTKTSGMPGQFDVDISQGGSASTVKVGAIVVATGFRPYDPGKLGHLGYGASPDVVTNFELEGMLANGGVKRKSDGNAPKTVAFIQCAGSRDPDHLPYCSSMCCSMSIKQAVQMTEADPDVMCYVIYDELRTPGVAEEFYRSAQEKGVVFVKGKAKSVDGSLKVVYDDEFLQEEIPMEGLDMVVLATGMVPNSTNPEQPAVEINDEQTKYMKDDINPVAPIAVAGYGEGVEAPAPAVRNEAAMPEGAPILNLQYRQGPHIPMLADGFADSHYICFPYETRRTGIYTCGPVRRPMDMDEAADDGMGAALKAIQAIRNVAQGQALHPRSGDLSYPKVNLNACTKCRRCTVECPFGAIDETPEDYPVINPSRCRRCGTCMGACPVRTISFDNYTVEMLTSMAKACEIPDEFSGKPRVLILACRNDAYPALDMAGIQRETYNAHVRVIPVRCLGSVSLLCVNDALSAGYDGIILMGCKSGDDYQCHFVKGSAMAQER